MGRVLQAADDRGIIGRDADDPERQNEAGLGEYGKTAGTPPAQPRLVEEGTSSPCSSVSPPPSYVRFARTLKPQPAACPGV